MQPHPAAFFAWPTVRVWSAVYSAGVQQPTTPQQVTAGVAARMIAECISHHLKVLREAGLIEGDRRGTWIYYRVVPETLRALADALVPAVVSV